MAESVLVVGYEYVNLENYRMLVRQTELFVSMQILLRNWYSWLRKNDITVFFVI